MRLFITKIQITYLLCVFSPRAPLYELTGHTDKLLCCDWFGRFLISGGADNAMRVYKARKPAC